MPAVLARITFSFHALHKKGRFLNVFAVGVTISQAMHNVFASTNRIIMNA